MCIINTVLGSRKKENLQYKQVLIQVLLYTKYNTLFFENVLLMLFYKDEKSMPNEAIHEINKFQKDVMVSIEQ